MVGNIRRATFIVPVQTLTFDRSQRKQFVETLETYDAALNYHRIEEPDDLMFNREGLFQGAYRLNTLGASQLFGEICPGFYSVVRALCNDDHEGINSQEVIPLICGTSNRIARHRFPQLEGCRVILDDERKELDGFVGRRYVLVKNSQVFNQFVQGCEMIRGNPEFFGAQLHGRDLTATFAVTKPLASRQVDRRFYTGVAVQNRESAGRAVRAANIVYDSITQTWSADQFYTETRVPHTRGKRFRDKMMRMADALATRQPKQSVLLNRFGEASAIVLGPKLDDSLLAKIGKRLAARASSFNVNKTQIDQVLEDLRITKSGKCRLLDVYSACLRVATNGRVSNSLPLRQLAWNIVMAGE